MNKRITIKDIARELNIHHSTVSRALRNDPRVNEKTRDLVLAFAQEHEYQTNMNAVQLRGTGNNAIALIVPNINHSFFSDIVSKLTNLAYEKGYVISVFQSNEEYLQEKEIINTIIQHNFAGVIVSIAKDTVNSDRHRGYIAAIQKHELEYKNPIVVTEEFKFDLGKKIFTDMIDSGNIPDAIICSSIHLTMGILSETRKRGISIPTDLGLITFGNILAAEIIQPQISSIEQPETEIAELSFELLEKLITDKNSLNNNEEKVVESHLIIRESC